MYFNKLVIFTFIFTALVRYNRHTKTANIFSVHFHKLWNMYTTTITIKIINIFISPQTFLAPLYNSSLSPLLPDNHWSGFQQIRFSANISLLVLNFFFYKWNHLSGFFNSVSLFWDSSLPLVSVVNYCQVLFQGMAIPQFVYPITHWWALGLFWIWKILMLFVDSKRWLTHNFFNCLLKSSRN